ncbi:MAG: hypothetical protein Q9160_008830 [Pyrenula sp. 1 TL-2023]
MAPAKKRRKLDSSTSDSKSKTTKATPHVEAVNALDPHSFWSKYCREIRATGEPRRAPNFYLNPQILFDPPPLRDASEVGAQEMCLLFRASSQLDRRELDACFNLIAHTSKEDYESSSMGWSPTKKRKEMRLPDLKYLLLVAHPREGSEEPQEASKDHHITDDPRNVNNSHGLNHYKIGGFFSLMPTYEDGRAVSYIYEIHVEPALQGTGLGHILMKIAESISKNVTRLEKMMLTVFRSNERARRFYEKLEWELDENSPEWVGLRRGRRRQCDYLILSKCLESTEPWTQSQPKNCV